MLMNFFLSLDFTIDTTANLSDNNALSHAVRFRLSNEFILNVSQQGKPKFFYPRYWMISLSRSCLTISSP